MYRFKTKDGQYARIDPMAVRAIIPSGMRTGFAKLVVDGGHAVTVEGEAETVHEILMQYRSHPVAPSAGEVSAAERLLPGAMADVAASMSEVRTALREYRSVCDEIASSAPPATSPETC